MQLGWMDSFVKLRTYSLQNNIYTSIQIRTLGDDLDCMYLLYSFIVIKQQLKKT